MTASITDVDPSEDVTVQDQLKLASDALAQTVEKVQWELERRISEELGK